MLVTGNYTVRQTVSVDPVEILEKLKESILKDTEGVYLHIDHRGKVVGYENYTTAHVKNWPHDIRDATPEEIELWKALNLAIEYAKKEFQ